MPILKQEQAVLFDMSSIYTDRSTGWILDLKTALDIKEQVFSLAHMSYMLPRACSVTACIPSCHKCMLQ